MYCTGVCLVGLWQTTKNLKVFVRISLDSNRVLTFQTLVVGEKRSRLRACTGRCGKIELM
jgi:hypothetical protein